MPEAQDGGGTNVDSVKLTPEQEAAIEKIKGQKGGVAAGRRAYAERHKSAADRRAERGY
jgi:hypothetical protein